MVGGRVSGFASVARSAAFLLGLFCVLGALSTMDHLTLGLLGVALMVPAVRENW